MSDFAQLLLILAAIYLLECTRWVPFGSVAIGSLFTFWRLVLHPVGWMSNDRGGFTPVSPLPFDISVNCGHWPLSISPQGVLAYVAQTINSTRRPVQSARFVSFDEIDSVSVNDRTLLVNGQPMHRFDSNDRARRFARLLQQLRRLDPAQRELWLLRAVQYSTDVRSIARRLRWFGRRSRWVRLWSTLLMLFIFALLPGMYYNLGLSAFWPALIATYVFLQVMAVLSFYRMHRHMYRRSAADRWRSVLIMILAPTNTMRASDRLAHDLLSVFHPLAVMISTIPTATMRAHARRILLDARHPIEPACDHVDPRAVQAEAWYRQQLLGVLEQTITRAGINVKDLVRYQPDSRAEHAWAYCPRCEACFIDPHARCASCGGMIVVPIKQ